MSKLKMAQRTSQVVGAPYKLGENTFSGGFDCLSLLHHIGTKAGFEVPLEFEGYTMETYKEFFKKDRKEAMKVFARLMISVGKEIKPNFAFTGDLLMIENIKSGEISMAIHAGNDRALSVYEKSGVTLVDLRVNKITRAFRWRKSCPE